MWNDLNPILASPTALPQLFTEWSQCQPWDDLTPSFWFDPLIALRTALVEASVTMPDVRSSTTAALPSSTAASGGLEETGPSSAATTTSQFGGTGGGRRDQSTSTSIPQTSSNQPAVGLGTKPASSTSDPETESSVRNLAVANIGNFIASVLSMAQFSTQQDHTATNAGNIAPDSSDSTMQQLTSASVGSGSDIAVSPDSQLPAAVPAASNEPDW
ncbi:hypothetical protein EJ03DRAFT_91702 [Teratosphaeria nubilosa]|uniref:Uncharacterized protein n=1 Tax=Teratosphaeria nubilosa TaxID=161662 RepID=A0A6G1LAQ7_9PEZI|nr:hypothetical protein EJ03DRAFT_91702 [Teratosphaeria nubilosa]